MTTRRMQYMTGAMCTGLLVLLAASEFWAFAYAGSNGRRVWAATVLEGVVSVSTSTVAIGGGPRPGLEVLRAGAERGVTWGERTWWPAMGGGHGIWAVIPLWMPAAISAAAFVISLRGRHGANGGCLSCGYDTSRSTASVCPECGADVSDNRGNRVSSRSVRSAGA